MTATEQQSTLYAQLDGDLGSISIRRVVFPPLQSARNTGTSEPVDLDDD